MDDKHVQVLLVDDETTLRDPLARYLRQKYGYQVDTAAHGAEALALAEQKAGQYDVALIDYLLIPAPNQEPEPLGIQLMQKIRGWCPQTEFILFTGWDMDTQAGLDALRAGAYRYIRKPFDHVELSAMIEYAAERGRLKSAEREKQVLEQLAITSAALLRGQRLQEVLDTVLRGVQTLGFDRVRLYLLSEDGQSLVGRAHVGMEQAFIGLELPMASDPYVQALFADARSQIFRRTDGQPMPHEQRLGKEEVRQWASAPLLFQDKPVGKLSVDNKFSQRPLLEAELGPLSLFASQAAAAIDRANLMEATQAATKKTATYARNLAAVQEVTRAISSLVDSDAILRSACKAGVELFGVSHSGLVRFEPDYREGRVVAEYPDWGAVGLMIPVEGIPAEEELITSQEPLALSDVANEPTLGPVRAILARLGVRSILFVPVVAKGKVLASFSLDVTDRPRSFTDAEVELCKTFAAQVAVALENAELFAEAKRHTERLEKLRRASLAITSQLERKKLLQVIVDKAVAFLDAQGGCVYEYEAENKELRAVASQGLPADLQGHVLRIGEGIAGRLVQNDQPYLVVDNYEEWEGRAEVYAGKVQFGSVIDVMLKWHDRIVGVLCVNDKVDRKFTQMDAELLCLFADHAAIALINAELVAESNGQKDRWQRLLANSPTGVIAIDREGSVTGFNEQAQVILQYLAEEAHGKHVTLLYNDPQEPRRIGALLQASPDGKLRNHLTFVRNKEGKRIPIRLSATWLYDAQQNKIGSVGYFEDLRAIQEAEKRLELLLKASNVVAQAENQKEGLQRLAELLVTFLGASFGGIQLLDERGQFLVVEAAFPTQQGELAWNPRMGDRTPVTNWPGLAAFLAQSDPAILHLYEQQHESLLQTISDAYQTPQIIQSMLFIPLQTGERAVGLLFLAELRAWDEAPFSQKRVALALAIGAQTAVLIDRMRLQESAQLAHERLRLSYEASNTLVSSDNPNQILHEIVEQARIAAGAAWVSILLIDEMGHVQKLIKAGIDKAFEIAAVIRSNGISVQVMRTGEVKLIEDASQQREQVNPSMFRDGVVAALCLPLSLRDKRIGVMWVHWQEPHYFPEAEVEAMRLYANQAAIAYDSSRRIAELEHMRRTAEVLAGAAGVREVLEQIVRSAREVLQADSAVIWSYDAAADRFTLEESVAVGIDHLVWEQFRKQGPRRRGTANAVMEQGWVGVEDIEDNPRYKFLGASTRNLLERIGARSFQGVELEVIGLKLGVLYVNYNRTRSFNAEERATAQTFANHAALALRKAKLLDQVSKARSTATVVAKVTTLGDLGATLDAVVSGTRNALGADAVTLYVFEQRTGKFRYPPAISGVWYPERVQRYAGVQPDSIVFAMLNRDEIYLARDTATDPWFKDRRFTIEEGVASSCAIPLSAGGERVGVMFVNYRTQRHVTNDELVDMQLFAHQAAVAIRNAQLYEGLQKRTDFLEALYAAGRAVTASLDLQEILFRIAEEAAHLIGDATDQEAFADIMLVEGTEARHVASFPHQELAIIHAAVGTGIDLATGKDGRIDVIGRAIKTGEAQLVGDVTEDPDYLASHAQTRSELAVPIKLEEQVIGVIAVEHPQPHAFDREDRRALEALADHAAIAIQNARQYQELEETRNQVAASTALAWMGMTSSVWRHAIGNYATTIDDLATLVQRDLEQAGLHSEGPMASLTHIREMVRKIRETPITAPLSAEEEGESVALNELLQERVKQLRENESYRRIQFRFDYQLAHTATVRISPEWLRRVFDLFIENAVKAMHSCVTRQIMVKTVAINGGAKITIADTGPGIPADILDLLFKSRIQKEKGAKGMGIGLLMAKTILQAYRGTVSVESSGPTGTTIQVWLPLESKKTKRG